MLQRSLGSPQAVRGSCRLICRASLRTHASSRGISSGTSRLRPQQQPASARRCMVVWAGRNEPLPFALSPPQRRLKFPWDSRLIAGRPGDIQVEVDMLQEGSPRGMSHPQVEALLNSLEPHCQAIVRLALAAKLRHVPSYRPPQVANLSLVLCDDPYIRQLNASSRSKDEATDVLSFEMPDEAGVYLPIKMLGDVVISLDTAERQARERSHSLLDEVRILLVHGVLHLAGFDHEEGGDQAATMAAEEAAIMSEMGWKGEGLISAAATAAAASEAQEAKASPAAATTTSSSSSRQQPKGGLQQQASSSKGSGSNDHASSSSQTVAADSSSSSSSSKSSSSSSSSRTQTVAGAPVSSASGQPPPKRQRKPQVKLVALDMDGTLLNSSSSIPPAAASAIRAACSRGVRVIIATGKARPGALAAVRAAGLEGDDLLLSLQTPGVFLQGLAVHGSSGQQLTDAALPRDVVSAAFSWAQGAGISCCAFLGDTCATLQLTPQLQELHHRYYEPLAQEAPDLETLLSGPPVKKLLFMAPPEVVEGAVKPHWGAQLAGSGAEVLQAVPNMLEVVPAGVNKWAGLQVLLEHLDVPREAFMAVGDGSNDLQMVANAGVGVAMGNAVPSVAAAAHAVVASNDDGGIVEAFERFVL